MKDKVQQWITEKALIAENDTVICAVSGGADSVAMLNVLLELQGAVDFSLEVCHMNHGLRGEDADEDALFVKELAAKKGLPFHGKSVDVTKIAAEQRVSIETAGRLARYAFFEELSQEGETVKIATAHTATDQVETMLFYLLRGTGLTGLCGIPAKRSVIIRPMRTVSRNEIEEYLGKRKILYREDQSNASLEYTRNQIRLTVLPLLREFQPDLESHFLETSEQLSEIHAFLEKEAEELRISSFDQRGGYDRKTLLDADSAVQSVFFRDILQKEKLPVDANRIHKCKKILQKPNRISLDKDTMAESYHGKFRIVHKNMVGESLCILGKMGENQLSDGRICYIREISSEKPQSLKKIHDRHLKNHFDCDRIGKEFTLRTRQPGDVFSPAGRGVSKTLKKLFNEKGLTIQQKTHCIIAESEKGIFWVEGFGVAQWATPTDDTQIIGEIFIEEGLSRE